MLNKDIWLSDKIIVAKDGFMRVDKRISNDKIFKREIEFSEDTLRVLEQSRKKTPSEQDYVKQLVENF